ncbi:acetylxylan esterase [bacterium]|nr:acetylxylan esterase [bacterium]
MNSRAFRHLLLVAGLGLLFGLNYAEGETDVDRRGVEIKHQESPNLFRHPTDLADWKARRQELQNALRASLALSPEPLRGTAEPRVFGRIELPDLTIDKVLLETHPGYFLTCNLYRPRELSGEHPAILCPHGHWPDGRLQMDVAVARSFNFARQGYVVLTYDMIGFGDSRQIRHDATGPMQELWGLTVSQLQTWNSICALEFLLSLPEVDAARIACTGASGGGTQTFLLCAVDERVAVSAPVNMISSHFQGGCICENAPYLRLDTYNVEIAALMAPRPMLMVSCSGDWTLNTPWVEYPLVKSIYALYGRADRVEMYRQIAGHNYNAKSREAVYKFFDHRLMGHSPGRDLKDEPVAGFKQDDLRIRREDWPEGLENQEALLARWRAGLAERLAAAAPRDAASLLAYQKSYGEVYPYSLAAKKPALTDLETWGTAPILRGERFYLGRKGEGDRIPARFYPAEKSGAPVVAWIDGEGSSAFTDALARPDSLPARLLSAGYSVLAPDVFNVGDAEAARERTGYFSTYNRSDVTHRVQDILTSIAWAEHVGRPVHLVGRGEGGLWVLLAQGLAGVTGSTIADAAQFDASSDPAFIERLFVPGLRRVGDFTTAAALAVPGRLFIHNTGDAFADAAYAHTYAAAGAKERLRLLRQPAGNDALLAFLCDAEAAR